MQSHPLTKVCNKYQLEGARESALSPLVKWFKHYYYYYYVLLLDLQLLLRLQLQLHPKTRKGEGEERAGNCLPVYLACTLSKYSASKIMGSRPWPFRVTRRHQSRDHLTRDGRLPMGGPLQPCVYLATLWRYSTSKTCTQTHPHPRTPTCTHTHETMDRMTIS